MTRFGVSALAVLAAMLLGPLPAGPARVADPCDLLRDPATRAQLSGALEIKLMVRCGEVTPSQLRQRRRAVRDRGVVQPVPAPPEEPSGVPPDMEDLLEEAPGVDILVNNPALDVGGTTQSETSVVVNGQVVCAAWNDAGEGFGANGFSGFGSSQDGGATWSDRGPFPNGPGPDRNGGDPSLVFSARDNAYYYAALSTLGLSVWRSLDGCRSFAYVGPIHVGGGDDKEIMAVDNNPASPFFGRLYVAWTNFSLPVNTRFQVTFSNNGGVSWSAPVSLPNTSSGQGVWPAVAPNGDVYVALMFQSFAPGAFQTQAIYRSADGGVSFARRTDIATNQLRPEEPADTAACGRQAVKGRIRNLSSPQIAIHPDAGAPAGHVIHAVWPYDSDGAGPDRSNVFYARSTDGGATWSAERKLNDDATSTDQWFPAVGVNADGTVAASWYDRRLDPANNMNFERFAAVSMDGGVTWGGNMRISDVTSPVSTNLPHFDGLARCYHGDYDQVAVDAATAHIVWSDDRRITQTGPNPDIYYDRVVFEAPPGESGRCKGATKVTFATGETLGESTTSTSFVDIPDMTVAFTLGGRGRNCVKVEVSAYAFAASDRLMFVRAVLDGATVGSPSGVQFVGDNEGQWAKSHGFNFEFKDVTPGAHTIKIQFRSHDGGQVFVHRRSVFVHHK